MNVKDQILKRLDALIGQGNTLLTSFRYGDMGVIQSDLPEADFRTFATAAYSAVCDVCGQDSQYFRMLPVLVANEPLSVPGYHNTKVPAMLGSLNALRSAVDGGYLTHLEVRLRANIHSDFLEQARVLLESGYHVAAMVLVGGVLEDHLQKLCTARGLSWKGDGSISKYNDVLHGTVYDKPTWRRIQSVGDIRNDAAHGKGANVKLSDVEDALKFAGRFIVDHTP